LNPPADTTIQPGDHLIAIAADDTTLATAGLSAARVDEEAILTPPPVRAHTARVLILGFNDRTPAVLEELDRYVEPGSSALVVAEHPTAEEQVAELAPRLGSLAPEFRRGVITARRTLEQLDVTSYDQAIVMPYSEQLDPQRADARTLVTLLHLRDIADREGAPLSVVSEMLDERNRELAQVTQVDDVIVSARLISLMITQISENPDLEDVFADLLGAGGAEIYLRPAFQYVRPGRSVTFATVVEAARLRGEIAIGYRPAGQKRPDPTWVNTPKPARVAAADGDSVIVLARA
jgi:ion channel POLLUX/CASTOR